MKRYVITCLALTLAMIQFGGCASIADPSPQADRRVFIIADSAVDWAIMPGENSDCDATTFTGQVLGSQSVR